MSKQAFKQSDYLKGNTLKLIQHANAVIEEYQAQGYKLSIRQLYYQFVARGWLDNIYANYKRVIEAVKQGRMNGLIDWDAIEDRMREATRFPEFQNPSHIQGELHRWYGEQLWHNQNNYILILSEKDAVSGIVERACSEWRVSSMMCRGFTSLSALYELGNQLAYIRSTGKSIHVLHLGDHDPSGQDMTRDNEKRLRIFMDDPEFELERIALNMDQIRALNPPPAPVKKKDSRAPAYIRKYGKEVWELDALEPKYIDDLVQNRIRELCDVPKLKIERAIENRNKRELKYMGANYDRALSLLLHVDHEAEK